jgi:hypothetical protein
MPGFLVAEKDPLGNIWQTQLFIHPVAVRSGMHINFDKPFSKIQSHAQMMKEIPLSVFINGQQRKMGPMQQDDVAIRNNGIAVLPHCFVSDVIYLQ